MSIDINIYGDSTEWADYWFGNCKMTDYSLWEKVIAGDWTLNELIDNSVCYFGAIGNFYAANPIAFFKTNNERVLLYPDAPVHNMLFMLNRANANGWTYNASSAGSTNNKWSKWDNTTDLPYYYNAYSNQVLFNFKLNKLLFIPYVTVSETNGIDADTDTYTLGEWIANHSVDHPYLHQVYLITYYNSGTIENPVWNDATVHADHYIWLNKNAEFAEDFYNRGDRNVLSTYSIGGDPDERRHLVIMGLGSTSGKEVINDTIPFVSAPIGFDPDTTHYIYDDNDNPSYVRYLRTYSATLVDEIYKQIAFLGVFFLGSGTGDFSNIALTDNRVFLGIIDNGGYTHGDYTRGVDNADQPQYEWDDTSSSSYDPKKEVDPNKYDGVMNINVMADIETVTNRYSLSSLSYSQLSGKLWEIMADIPADTTPTEYALDVFLTTNPIDNIVSLKYFPLVDDPNYGTGIHVHLGSYDTNIPAFKAKTVVQHQCGRIKIFPQFNDWRDYETEIMLYLPFCGTISIDPKIYMNRWLYVDYVIDIITGNCAAAVYVFADNGNKMIVEIANGNCSIDLPITGIEQVTLQGQMYNATEQMKQLRVNNDISELSLATSLIGAMSSGNVLGAASNLFNAAGTLMNNITAENIAEYEIQHMKVPVKMIGTTGSVTGLCMELYPTIIYIRPTTARGFDIAKYGHTVGFADCSPCVIGTKSGYAEFTNVDLSGFNATEKEKQMIAAALASGVYI